MGLHRYSIASPTTLLLRLRLLDSKAVSSAGLLNHAHLPAAAAAAAPRLGSTPPRYTLVVACRPFTAQMAPTPGTRNEEPGPCRLTRPVDPVASLSTLHSNSRGRGHAPPSFENRIANDIQPQPPTLRLRLPLPTCHDAKMEDMTISSIPARGGK
ncbi:hypothetical protein ACJQWK_03194 [Exserohilum turcicum]